METGFRRVLAAALFVAFLLAATRSGANDADETAYTPSTMAKIMGGAPRSLNDEAELVATGQWYTTTATYTGQKRRPSSRFRPLISSWLSSRGMEGDVEMYFGGELPELQFEQAGKKYWVMAGLPGGLGFDVYPPGQKLSIYLQRVGFASGTPVAVLTLAKLPSGVTSTTVPAPGRRMHNARMGEGARRQEGTFKNGSATFTYAGREYSLPLDLAGRHSVAPGLYSYENGVRAALLEYGAGDDQYLLLRVPVIDGNEAPSLVPYLVLNGRIVPPIDVGPCSVIVEKVQRAGTAGQVDCGDSPRAVFRKLRFNAE